ncbi:MULTISPECIES: DUF2271 domain-containing protein [Halopseudomonas]|jgi:hypothetical protein|uniref:DUF2271 domain-containing protein n=2 Tax=Halopseudomonas TaxID=2901189 RepID=A0A1H9NEW0_9GAMM|nr:MULTISPECIES: DUF2271 domain-containing protein [Halopseudomonas]SER34496.1 Predicted protein [Halopseudomonas bauzanensis]SFL81601.1 Predicted protein [Halopseudomonas bauzanensis]SFQ85918.1 Predicted protein [Halopseudomonas formosensis]
MNRKLITLSLVLSLGLPTLAQARPVTFSTTLSDYGGDGAYVVLYLTDAQGQYQQTLWVAGKKAKYYKHLRDWARGSGLRSAEYDGMTGASVTSGRTLEVTLELADGLIDSGVQVRIDTAVEDMRENRSEVVVPLTTEGAGQVTAGKGYVQSFTYTF